MLNFNIYADNEQKKNNYLTIEMLNDTNGYLNYPNIKKEVLYVFLDPGCRYSRKAYNNLKKHLETYPIKIIPLSVMGEKSINPAKLMLLTNNIKYYDIAMTKNIGKSNNVFNELIKAINLKENLDDLLHQNNAIYYKIITQLNESKLINGKIIPIAFLYKKNEQKFKVILPLSQTKFIDDFFNNIK